MSHAVVIGGGIGGLTAAVALSNKGWSVTVCERAGSLEPVGAGIAMAPNALKALDTIGVGDDVRKLSAMQGDGGVSRYDGKWISRTNAEAARARYGDPVVLLLRSTLVNLLVSRLDGGALRLDTTVHSVDAATGRVVTSEGDLEGDLVVAADGIHSAVRRSLFPSHPGLAYSGVTSWRSVVTTPKNAKMRNSETWGRGQVFGATSMADDLVYWYATAPTPPGQKAPHGEKAELLRLFSDWHAPIPELLAGSEENRILRHDLYSLAAPLPAFHSGRVALLGDAAHAMTPNLGQGACQAIEDGVVLAHIAGQATRPNLDLGRYTSARLEHTTKVMRRSQAICRLSGWSNPVAVYLRNTALTLAGRLGDNVTLRQLDDVVNWRLPVS